MEQEISITNYIYMKMYIYQKTQRIVESFANNRCFGFLLNHPQGYLDM